MLIGCVWRSAPDVSASGAGSEKQGNQEASGSNKVGRDEVPHCHRDTGVSGAKLPTLWRSETWCGRNHLTHWGQFIYTARRSDHHHESPFIIWVDVVRWTEHEPRSWMSPRARDRALVQTPSRLTAWKCRLWTRVFADVWLVQDGTCFSSHYKIFSFFFFLLFSVFPQGCSVSYSCSAQLKNK